MINSIDQYNPAIIEITTPFTHLNFHMIDMKGWNGQIIKTDVNLFKILLENVMSIQLTHELRNDKKLTKNLTNINIQIGKIANMITDDGVSVDEQDPKKLEKYHNFAKDNFNLNDESALQLVYESLLYLKIKNS